jgi:hypothetical protein
MNDFWMQFVKYRPKEHFEPLTAETQDGVKNQMHQNFKNHIFAAKWPIFNGFQKTFLRFVRPTSVY